MDEDGTLSAGASYLKNIQRYNLGFQVLPYLETSFRYSGLSKFSPGFPVYWDRSFGIKLRLVEEGDVMPTVALGINDIIGTGLYSSEYLVASKQFGAFDASIGLGWGRLGSANTFDNPLGKVFSSLNNPRPGLSTPGGTPFNSFFHGPTAGVFGGVNWRTPIDGLTLSVENSSDAFSFEQQQGTFQPHSRWNYGASYRFGSGTLLNLGYLYGNSFSAGIAFELDPTRPQFSANIGRPVPQPVIRNENAQRAALQALANQHNPQRNNDRAWAENRDGFVDALMAARGVGDVSLVGHTLNVTIASTVGAQSLCRSVASSIQTSDTGLTDVTIRAANGATMARCGVLRQVQATAHFADFVRQNPLSLSEDTPLVIDATEVRPVVDRRAAERKFRADVRKQTIGLQAVLFTETEATVYYNNYHYFHESDAIERLTRLLMEDAPPTIEKFRLISVQSSIPQQEYHILRTPVERALAEDEENPSIFSSPITIQSASMKNPVLRAQSHYPLLDWDIYPQFRQQFFDPNNPLGVQFVAAAEFGLELAPGLLLYGEGEISLFDTFNTNRPSDSVLPHVRTDFERYFSEGKNGMGAFNLSYRTRLAPEFYATVKGGYLESMLSGAGGEVLYRRDGARWALGADFYEVWQRDFDRLFGLMPYHVATGHVTLYWASPFYNLDFQLRAGQYLAGDRGLTLQISRRFSTGIQIGAWATKTNVSSAQFGEGSFDKGILIRIPLGWVAPINTQNQIDMDLRPVQRDGGQTLLGDATLYDETNRSSEGEFARQGISFANDN